MGRVIARIWVIAAICLVGERPVSAEAFRVDPYFMSEQELPKLDILEIAPSPEPWVLFEALMKRLSIITPTEFKRDPRDIRSIAADGRADQTALIFLLLNLFRLNGIDTELVFLSTTQDLENGDRYIEQMLVYVPAIKQYFDPALPSDRQHDSADLTWLEGRQRLHFSAALQHKGKAVGRCHDLCLFVAGKGGGNYRFRDPYAVPIKTIRVPVTRVTGPESPR